MRLTVRLAVNGGETACAADGNGLTWTFVMCIFSHVKVYRPLSTCSLPAVYGGSLIWNDVAMADDVERDGAFKTCCCFGFSCNPMMWGYKLCSVPQRSYEPEYDVVLQRIGNASCKVSHLESCILQDHKMLATSAHAVMCECYAVPWCICSMLVWCRSWWMQIWSGQVVSDHLIKLADAWIGDGSSRSEVG